MISIFVSHLHERDEKVLPLTYVILEALILPKLSFP